MSVADNASRFGLTPLQEGMVFNQLLSPRSGVDIVQMIVVLPEPVDVSRLEDCWSRVTRRHDMLRVCFEIGSDGANRQRVTDDVAPVFRVEDWTDRGAQVREREWEAFLRRDREAGFDLSRAPLSRVTLVRVSEADYRLVWTFFHATVDGRAVTIVLRELFDFYDHDGANTPTDPGAPFRSYVQWLSSQEFPGADAYWHRMFEGMDGPTEVPMLAPDGPAAGLSVHRERRAHLSAEVTAALRSLSKQEGATMNSIVLGAWALLLARCSRQDEVVFGIVKTCRRASVPGAEDIVGPFVNTLPLRLRVDDRSTTRHWLGDIRGAWLDLRKFEHTPIPRIQAASGFAKDTPLFETAIGYERYDYITHFRQVDPERWRHRFIKPLIQTSFPLVVLAFDGDELLLWADYDPARLDDRGAERLLERLTVILEQMARRPDSPLGDLEFMSGAERELVVRTLNETRRDLIDPRPAPEQIASVARDRPNAVAVADAHGAITFGELIERAGRVAAGLERLGVGRGGMVGVCVDRHAGMVPAFLGVMLAGCAYAPLDPAHPPDRLGRMARDLGSPVVLTQGHLVPRFENAAVRAVVIDELIREHEPAASPVTIAPESVAYVVFTSGSTGEPKGVRVSHGALTNLVSWHRRVYGLGGSDVCTQVAGVGFDACVWELWPALCAGATTHVIPEEVVADADAMWGSLETLGVTVSFIPTPVAEAMLADESPAPRALRAMLTGGDRLTAAPARALPFRLVNHYGPTENTVVATAGDVQPGDPGPPHIGSAIDNVRVYIVDGALRPMPVGIPGELCVAGAQVARGYVGRDDLTAQLFVPCPFESGGVMYRTGDLVRRREDGAIDFLGRIDGQIKVRGYRIEPGDIESAIARDSGVRRSVVLRDDEASGGPALRAFVVVDTEKAAAVNGSDGDGRALIEDWRSLYDATYDSGESAAEDAAFNIIGWNSSYTGEPIPADEMREWVEEAASRVLIHRPRRLLEIGCGTGLILARVAPVCERYVGLDLSEKALVAVRAAIREHPELAHAELHRRAAHELEGVGDGFDTVVMNSVVQYFPDIEYLVRVIERAATLVRDGGRIVIGDVRSLPLLEAYHASIRLHRGADAMTPTEFRESVARGAAREEELVIDPAAFGAMVGRVPRITGARAMLKRGAAHNELTRFRYEVVLEVGGAPRPAPAMADRLAADATTAIAAVREASERGSHRIITGVPNARLWRERAALRWMRGGTDDGATLGELRRRLDACERRGAEPSDLWALDREEFRVELITSSCGDAASFDVAAGLDASAIGLTGDGRPWGLMANNPRAGVLLREAPERIRAALTRSLPSYMIPSSITVVESIPLTRNGKVDRRALLRRVESAGRARAYTEPKSETERAIAGAWRELLRVERVGSTDNFFELGGHSLLATRLTSMLRDSLGVEVPLRAIFDAPTVEAMAVHVEALRWAAQGDSGEQSVGREVFDL